MRARKRRTRFQTLTNSDYQFNPFSFEMEKKLRNADKKRGIKAKYDIKYLDGNRYIGETDDGFFVQIREGKGIFYYKNGDRYEGDFKDGNKEGKGIYYHKSGNRYEGEFKNNKRNGKGIFYYKNGDRYEGDFKNGNFEGKGKYYYKDGAKYDGYWKDDKRDGKGTLYYPDEKIKYQGEFKNNYFNGKGKYYYKDGAKYDGYWKNNKKNGKGIYYYNDGDIYEGEFKNDQYEGKGIYYYNDGDRYDGDWKDGNKEGKGILYYPDDTIKYNGEFKNDYINGKGIYYYNDGDIYDGYWKNDKRDGKGIYYYDNGDRYEGDWKDGNKEGKGIHYHKSGHRYEGDYKNDILINGKKYYKSTPKNRKDVFLQINENDEKESFLSKHKDGDYKYKDGDDIKITQDTKNSYVHLKIMYGDHGASDRSLRKDIDKQLFEQYKKNNLKSVYISSVACCGGFYDEKSNNLFKIVEDMMENQQNCIGFVSLAKAKNLLAYEQTTNENGKKGAKRVPKKKENIVENISDQNYDKNNDFEYYCIIQENKEYKIYQIPYQLCYWREYLIDAGKLMEAFNTLKEGKDYEFEAEVILNDGKSTKTEMEITIPSAWGMNKENTIKEVNPEEEQEIESNKSNHSSADINLKDLNKQNQLGE